MCVLGDPQLDKAARIYKNIVENMSERELMFNYIVLDVDFNFPQDTKYPSIPTRVDNDVDIYPIEGRSIITGPEYLTAKSMGCKLRVRSGVIIPFKGLDQKLKYTSNSDASQNKVSDVSQNKVSDVSKNKELNDD
jgi:hypothetical protein